MLININAHRTEVEQTEMRCDSENWMKLDLDFNSICSVKPSKSNIRGNKLLITKFYTKYQVVFMQKLLLMISEYSEFCVPDPQIISYDLKRNNKTIILHSSEVCICLNYIINLSLNLHNLLFF
jgi:hypothetical protein